MYILYYRTHADGKYDGRSVVTPLSPRSLTKCRGIATHARFEETLKRLKRSYALSLHERVPYRATTRRAGRVIALLIACYFHRASPHVRRSGCPFPPPYQPENITRARALIVITSLHVSGVRGGKGWANVVHARLPYTTQLILSRFYDSFTNWFFENDSPAPEPLRGQRLLETFINRFTRNTNTRRPTTVSDKRMRFTVYKNKMIKIILYFPSVSSATRSRKKIGYLLFAIKSSIW